MTSQATSRTTRSPTTSASRRAIRSTSASDSGPREPHGGRGAAGLGGDDAGTASSVSMMKPATWAGSARGALGACSVSAVERLLGGDRRGVAVGTAIRRRCPPLLAEVVVAEAERLALLLDEGGERRVVDRQEVLVGTARGGSASDLRLGCRRAAPRSRSPPGRLQVQLQLRLGLQAKDLALGGGRGAPRRVVDREGLSGHSAAAGAAAGSAARGGAAGAVPATGSSRRPTRRDQLLRVERLLEMGIGAARLGLALVERLEGAHQQDRRHPRMQLLGPADDLVAGGARACGRRR